MKKWIVKKTISPEIPKNTIIEETSKVHVEAIALGEYSGGFGLFSSGKNFEISDYGVVKILGKRKELNEHLEEYKETQLNSYRWIGPKTGNLIPGNVYNETQLKNSDQDVVLNSGMSKIFVSVLNEVYCIRGSNKIYDQYLKKVVKVVEVDNKKSTPIIETEVKKEIIKEVIHEIKLIGPTGSQGITGFTGVVGKTGKMGETGPIGIGIEKITPEDTNKIKIKLTSGDFYLLELPPGITGETGLVGFTGADGNTGAAGEQGLIGLSGKRGSRGVQGPMGPQGPQGSPGQRGERGSDGEPGIPGSMGSQGPAGARGPRGLKGLQGNPGKDGKDGKDGVMGKPGNAGKNADITEVKVQYPLVFNQSKKSIEIDKQFFEKLLSSGEVNSQLVNKFINAASSGGGGIGIYDSNKGKLLNRSIDTLYFSGSGVDINRVGGKNIKVNISGTKIYVSDDPPEASGVTGDRWIETDSGILYTRFQNNWVSF